MKNVALSIVFAGLSVLSVACNKSASGADASGSAKAEATGPCAGAAEGLSGIAILEVKDSKDNASEGVKLVDNLRKDIAAECIAKGYDKSQVDALGCYEKNKDKRGYFVWKSCDQKIGRELVDAAVAKNGGKKDDKKNAK